MVDCWDDVWRKISVVYHTSVLRNVFLFLILTFAGTRIIDGFDIYPSISSMPMLFIFNSWMLFFFMIIVFLLSMLYGYFVLGGLIVLLGVVMQSSTIIIIAVWSMVVFVCIDLVYASKNKG